MRRHHRTWMPLIAVGLGGMTVSALVAGDNPRPTPIAYGDEDLARHRPTPTPPQMDPDGRSTATAPPTPTPTSEPEEPYLPPRSLDMEQRKILQDQLAAAESRVANARKKITEIEARLAAASSLSRPLAIYRTTNPDVPAIEAELQAAKQSLSDEESNLSNIQDQVDRAHH
jgi:hypothetical protein